MWLRNVHYFFMGCPSGFLAGVTVAAFFFGYPETGLLMLPVAIYYNWQFFRLTCERNEI